MLALAIFFLGLGVVLLLAEVLPLLALALLVAGAACAWRARTDPT